MAKECCAVSSRKCEGLCRSGHKETVMEWSSGASQKEVHCPAFYIEEQKGRRR